MTVTPSRAAIEAAVKARWPDDSLNLKAALRAAYAVDLAKYEAVVEALALAATRFELLSGRFRGCDELNDFDPHQHKHALSIDESWTFAVDARAALAGVRGAEA